MCVCFGLPCHCVFDCFTSVTLQLKIQLGGLFAGLMQPHGADGRGRQVMHVHALL